MGKSLTGGGGGGGDRAITPGLQLWGSCEGGGDGGTGRKDGGQNCFLLENPRLDRGPSKAGASLPPALVTADLVVRGRKGRGSKCQWWGGNGCGGVIPARIRGSRPARWASRGQQPRAGVLQTQPPQGACSAMAIPPRGSKEARLLHTADAGARWGSEPRDVCGQPSPVSVSALGAHHEALTSPRVLRVRQAS